MINITKNISLHESEIKLTFVASPGPGGQNVNKVATAVQLRFDVVNNNSLPEIVRTRLLLTLKSRLTTQGELIIKASRFRTQERNKQDAINRLKEIIKHAATPIKKRKKTKPTATSIHRRLQKKKIHGTKKNLRGKISASD